MRSGINRHPYAIATMQSLPRRGGDVRPDFDWDKPGALMRAIDRQKIKPAIRDGRPSLGGNQKTLGRFMSVSCVKLTQTERI
jgi:hypothetical protein